MTGNVTKKRATPSYRQALNWLNENDDCSWVDEPEFGLSVAGALVADLFQKTDEEVVRDLRRVQAKTGDVR